jgi:glutathione S-transferase
VNLALMEQKQPSYLKLNPSGLVPTLLHDGDAIYESNVINEYIEAMVPTPALMPSDPRGQAEVRMWLAFESGWAPLFRDVFYETVAKERLKKNLSDPSQLEAEIKRRTSNPVYFRMTRQVLEQPKNEELVENRLAVLMERMQQMDERLADGRTWLAGDAFTLADLGLAPRIDMYPMIGVADIYQKFPRIGAWAERVKARPSWKRSEIFPEPGQTVTQVA